MHSSRVQTIETLLSNSPVTLEAAVLDNSQYHNISYTQAPDESRLMQKPLQATLGRHLPQPTTDINKTRDYRDQTRSKFKHYNLPYHLQKCGRNNERQDPKSDDAYVKLHGVDAQNTPPWMEH